MKEEMCCFFACYFDIEEKDVKLNFFVVVWLRFKNGLVLLIIQTGTTNTKLSMKEFYMVLQTKVATLPEVQQLQKIKQIIIKRKH